jgi:two-component system sensor histidine kinase/response regulator
VKSAPLTTILVADDNRENRALAQATLEDEGYRVELARNGEEAVAKVAAEHPDCILMDIRPWDTGVRSCRALMCFDGCPGGGRSATTSAAGSCETSSRVWS